MSIQRRIIRPGDMRNVPKKRDTVTILYTGWLYDAQSPTSGFKGRQFDSTTTRGKPLEFLLGLGLVVPGLDSVLVQMSLGEKTVWTIPANLGYGRRGFGTLIPPDVDLIFEVELIGVNDKKI